MLEERYEIRGKIGQGGLGAVYRAYDTRMNREVAIKRISSTDHDPELLKESTSQLIKEAGALASLQHPHIVTVYDVGSDSDGPYVVMELISGKTLDEIIEAAPLMWEDFRELAMQTQEALIAAQELQLIHRDIKPGNVMLTWLPSGKFQIKIVDFGLAKLASTPMLHDTDQAESVFGSVFFMAPELFERGEIDMRTDMYAMGCVYYHALTGVYPFNGGTGHEVMDAHLRHQVTPLQEVRDNIPLWVCDWIMWHINRQPADRPASARESLQVFLQNDKIKEPPMSTGTPAPTEETPKRPRLIIPGAAPAAPAPEPAVVPESTTDAQPVKTQTAPQPLTPPEGSKPSVHGTPPPAPAGDEAPAPPSADAVAVATPPVTVVPLARKGQVSASPAQTQPGSPMPAAPAPVVLTGAELSPKKRGLSNAAKMTIAIILGLASLLLGYYLLKKSGQNRETKIYNTLIQQAAPGDATEVLVTGPGLKILLEASVSLASNTDRATVYKALFLAKATDGTNVDAEIAEFATKRQMLPDIREVLIRDVLRKRRNPGIVPTLLAYAKSTDDVRSATAALQASRFMVGDAEFGHFLDVLQFASHENIRKAAEEAMAEIIRKSSDKPALAALLATAYLGAVDDDVRHSLLRLLGRAGGETALGHAKAMLGESEAKHRIAALVAMGSWGDETAFPVLMEFLAGSTDETLRARAFDSALRFVSATDLERDAATRESQWKELAAEAKTQAEQEKIIRGLVNNDQEDWVVPLVEKFAKESDYDRIIDLAERGLDRLKERARVRAVDRGEQEPEAPQDE